MKNLHSINPPLLVILLNFYQKQFNYVQTRIENNKLQVYDKYNNTWKDEKKDNIDELHRRWKDYGSPIYK